MVEVFDGKDEVDHDQALAQHCQLGEVMEVGRIAVEEDVPQKETHVDEQEEDQDASAGFHALLIKL